VAPNRARRGRGARCCASNRSQSKTPVVPVSASTGPGFHQRRPVGPALPDRRRHEHGVVGVEEQHGVGDGRGEKQRAIVPPRVGFPDAGQLAAGPSTGARKAVQKLVLDGVARELCDALADHRIDPNLPAGHRDSLLLDAIDAGRSDQVLALLAVGALPQAMPRNGDEPLARAADKGLPSTWGASPASGHEPATSAASTSANSSLVESPARCHHPATKPRPTPQAEQAQQARDAVQQAHRE